MALGYTIVKALPKGMSFRWRLVDLKMDTDYPTGGYPISAASLKLNGIIGVLPCGQEDGYVPVWDRSAGKIKIFVSDFSFSADAPLVEAASGLDDLTNKIVTCLVVGY